MPVNPVPRTRYGTKAEMVADTSDLLAGELFVTETDVFRWDPTPIDATAATFQNTNIVDSIRPGAPLTISSYRAQVLNQWNPAPFTGRWISQTQSRNSVDAQRSFGVSEKNTNNGPALQLAINETACLGRELLLLPPGRLHIAQKIFFHHEPFDPQRPEAPTNLGFPKIRRSDGSLDANYGGKLTLRGAGSGFDQTYFPGNPDPMSFGTLLDSTITNDHCFVMGRGNCNYGFGHFKVESLSFRAAHNLAPTGSFEQWAIFHLNYPQAWNAFRDVAFTQDGRGNGLVIVSAFHSELYGVRAGLGGPTPTDEYGELGIGIWLRSEQVTTCPEGQIDAYVGVLDLLNVSAGAAWPGGTYGGRYWKVGVQLGNGRPGGQGGRLSNGQVVGLSITRGIEGVVVGSAVTDTELAGIYTEGCKVCGVRIENGALNIKVRGFHGLDEMAPENGGEAELALGRGGASPSGCIGVVAEGVSVVRPHVPAVRVWPNVERATIRDIDVVHLKGTPPEALVKLENGGDANYRYKDLVVEATGVFKTVEGAKHASRVTFSGKNGAPVLSERVHESTGEALIADTDPLYHRVRGDGDSIRLPNMTGLMAERIGQEFHIVAEVIAPLGGIGNLTVKAGDGSTVAIVPRPGAVRVRWNGDGNGAASWNVIARA